MIQRYPRFRVQGFTEHGGDHNGSLDSRIPWGGFYTGSLRTPKEQTGCLQKHGQNGTRTPKLKHETLNPKIRQP